MRIPLIFTLNASDSQSGPYPAISSDAKILFDSVEFGDKTEFWVDKIECTDFLEAKTETVYWLDTPQNNTWCVSITNRRITFENSYSKGMIGGAKIKAGRLTAGHLPFDTISHLSAFFSNEGVPLLLCCCYRQDRTRSAVVIRACNIDTLRSLLSLLQGKLMAYLSNEGKLATVADIDQTKLSDALRKWNEMGEKAWLDRDVDYTVVVLNRSYAQVPNGRF